MEGWMGVTLQGTIGTDDVIKLQLLPFIVSLGRSTLWSVIDDYIQIYHHYTQKFATIDFNHVRWDSQYNQFKLASPMHRCNGQFYSPTFNLKNLPNILSFPIRHKVIFISISKSFQIQCCSAVSSHVLVLRLQKSSINVIALNKTVHKLGAVQVSCNRPQGRGSTVGSHLIAASGGGECYPHHTKKYTPCTPKYHSFNSKYS